MIKLFFIILVSHEIKSFFYYFYKFTFIILIKLMSKDLTDLKNKCLNKFIIILFNNHKINILSFSFIILVKLLLIKSSFIVLINCEIKSYIFFYYLVELN